MYINTRKSVYLYSRCVCADKDKINLINSVGFFQQVPLHLITIDLAVIVNVLFSFAFHQLHMVVVCINSYVVHICVCSLSSLILAQSQQ